MARHKLSIDIILNSKDLCNGCVCLDDWKCRQGYDIRIRDPFVGDFVRPQDCKDEHDTTPGYVYEFYMEEDTLRRRLYRINRDPAEIEGLLKVYKRANRDTYDISGWEAFLTSKLVDFVSIDEIDIDHSIYF